MSDLLAALVIVLVAEATRTCGPSWPLYAAAVLLGLLVGHSARRKR